MRLTSKPTPRINQTWNQAEVEDLRVTKRKHLQKTNQVNFILTANQ